MPAAVLHVDSQRLDVTADNVGSVAHWGRDHAERDRIDADDADGSGLVGESGDLASALFERPEVAWILEIDGRGLRCEGLLKAVEVELAGPRIDGQ